MCAHIHGTVRPRGKKSELRGCSFRWVIFWINFSEHLETFFQTTLVFTSFRVFFLWTSKKMSWGKLNLQRFSIIINAPSTMTWTPSQLSTTTLLPCKLWPSTWVLHVCFRLHAALRSQFSQTNFTRRMHDERANSKSNRIHVICSVTRNSWACKSSSAFVCCWQSWRFASEVQTELFFFRARLLSLRRKRRLGLHEK